MPLATISVRFLDAFGSVVDDGDIALAFSPDAAATVLGAVRSAVVGGTAVFTDLSLAGALLESPLAVAMVVTHHLPAFGWPCCI